MLVLGIESSCDETAAAIVADGTRILSNVVASQIRIHERFGGVVPELASREHLRKIVPVVDEACREARTTLQKIEAVAVTEGPGLIGSLLVGLVYGKALALSLRKPLVGVNHLEGHIHAVLLHNAIERREGKPIPATSCPSITLVVSGGHTILFRVDTNLTPTSRDPSFSYKMLGQTRDDAAGEAFDKVAKLLALGYPGGPVIDCLARDGNPRAFEFGRIRMKGNQLDFSFSGLKTAVLYRVRGTPLATEAEQRRAWREASPDKPSVEELRAHCSQATLDLVASFQDAAVTDLIERTVVAAHRARPHLAVDVHDAHRHPGQRERVADDGPVGPPRHRRRRGQVPAEQRPEHRRGEPPPGAAPGGGGSHPRRGRPSSRMSPARPAGRGCGLHPRGPGGSPPVPAAAPRSAAGPAR